MFGIEEKFILPPPALRARRVHSYGGDTLVIRTRSDSGRTRRHSQQLGSVRLRRIDDACVVRAVKGDPKYGNVFRSQFMCIFHKLPVSLPAGELELSIFEDGTLMFRDEFGDVSGPGEIVVIGDGEYVQAETVNERLFVSWSSLEAPREFLIDAARALRTPFGEGPADGYVQLSEVGPDGDAAEGSASDILEYLSSSEHPHVAYVRLTLEDGTRVSWSEHASRVQSSTKPYAEVSVDCQASSNRTAVLELIAGTGTDQLKLRKDVLASDIRQFVA